MAGDWIKMRSDLFTHPKVVRITSALKADRFRTVGGLMSVWCLFDVHSTDGRLDGYTLDTVDDLIGWPGFAAAMKNVGWLDEDSESLVLPEFDTHNGQSAKRRAQDSDRKRAGRLSASEADKNGTREEKRREEINTHTPGRAAQISMAMRKYTISANPAHPIVLTMAEQDVAIETIEACCKEVREAKPNETISPAYIAKKLEGWIEAAKNVNVTGAGKPGSKKFDDWYRSDAGISRKASELGIQARGGETYAGLRERCEAEMRRRAQGAAA